ncbi:MAG: hypothetical protein ACRD9L_14020 [Bryobacteraceae bacterium]
MNELNAWLKSVTRCLSGEDAARVRVEIQEHYDSAPEAALATGVSPEAAARLALSSLGDAKDTNRQYRLVMLTSGEARTLRDGNREARAVCRISWLKWFFSSLPVYTPARSRIFRIVRWTLMVAILLTAGKSSWLYFSFLWPFIWIEYTRASLRRKLPVARWPKQLYL